MKIQVFGSGCPSCHKLVELTRRAVKELNINEGVEYSDDIKKVIEMGVIQTPVLAINGKPVLTGPVSNIEKIKSALTSKIVSDNRDNKSGCSCGGEY